MLVTTYDNLPAEIFTDHARRKMDFVHDYNSHTEDQRIIDIKNKEAIFISDTQTIHWFWDNEQLVYVRHDEDAKLVRLYPAKHLMYRPVRY